MEKKKPVAYRMTGGSNNVMVGNTAVGYDEAYVVENERGSIVANNVAISLEAARLFAEARAAINAADAPEASKVEAHASLSALQASVGTAIFTSRYAELMTFLSDHATVFGAVSPIVTSIWKALTNG